MLCNIILPFAIPLENDVNIFLKSLHDPMLNQGCIINDRIKIIFGHGQLYFSLEERCIVFDSKLPQSSKKTLPIINDFHGIHFSK